jgi:ABC-2 type transport system ATP-binding protein
MDLSVNFQDVSYSYSEHRALHEVSFQVRAGDFFGLIGPNGGGKSTAFKLLSTSIKVQSGQIQVAGHDVTSASDSVRSDIGVVFQSPALDKKLTVEENLSHQGRLYGLTGKTLRKRVDEELTRFHLADRKKDRAEKLSGGLKRRLEIAKSLLHNPKVLILDEPTTGLDPLARRETWAYLRELNRSAGLTVLLTTHLLEEAASCDSIVLIDCGRKVSEGKPSELVETLGGDVVSIQTGNAADLAKRVSETFSVDATHVQNEVRVQIHAGHAFIPKLVESFSGEILSVTLGKPTLEDLFISKTGRKYAESV